MDSDGTGPRGRQPRELHPGDPSRPTRELPPAILCSLRKTKRCQYWAQNGSCQYGARCYYVHDAAERRQAPCFDKTKLCREILRGGACKNPACLFAHRREELRRQESVPRRPSAKAPPRAGHGYSPRSNNDINRNESPAVVPVAAFAKDDKESLFGLSDSSQPPHQTHNAMPPTAVRSNYDNRSAQPQGMGNSQPQGQFSGPATAQGPGINNWQQQGPNSHPQPGLNSQPPQGLNWQPY